MHEDPDYVEVYLNDVGLVTHVWVHFPGTARGRHVEVPVRVYAWGKERDHEDA